MTTNDRSGEADDDLPVLTHVLRTGDGRLPTTPVDDDSYIDEFGIHHFEEAPVTSQIVIGHDPHQPADDLVAATVNGRSAATSKSAVSDPRHVHRDPFRLPQDIDAGPGHVEPIDVPHLIGSSDGPERPPRPVESPKPVDTATMAARLRDSIFFDLASRIDMELDARIAQVLHAEIESALAQLQSSLRSHLTDALRDVVARAVDEELARLNHKPH